MTVHRALITEDQPDALAALVAIVESLGHEARTATTVDEALAAIAEECFCYHLLDQELPSKRGAQALVSGGARIMEAYRKRDDRRAGPESRRVTQIIVVSGFSREYPFVAKMFDLGADHFVPKPIADHVEELVDTIKKALERSGRREHAACAALDLHARPAVSTGESAPADADAASDVSRIDLVLDGGVEPGRTTFLVNAKRASLPDSKFVPLLRLAAVNERDAEEWTSRPLSGLVQRDTSTRIREGFKGLLPEGFELIEADRRGNFRLGPRVRARVEWRKLEGHPEPGVQKVVAEWKRRKGGHE